MPFGTWFKSLFSHKPSPHNLAGGLASAKVTLDQFAVIEHWDWIGQFDAAATSAINSLNAYQPGEPKDEIVQALNAAVGILENVQGLSDKDKLAIIAFTGVAESALNMLG